MSEIERRSSDPVERLLAVFDSLDTWFRRPEFEGCSFAWVTRGPGSRENH